LDGIQNHLPGDSKGEHAYIHFFDQDQQQRISLKEAQQTSNTLTKIRFVDDGIGYDLKNLLFFFSTKENDKDAVGQFGEGIKMIATASLREGVEIEFESQNRRAKPTTKDVLLESNKSTRTMQQLCYDVEYLKRERPFIGSKTTFHNPSRELINLAKGVGNTILHFKPDYEPIDTARDGEVVSLDDRRLYLKGLYINDADNSTYFSYNFYEGEPNRDRDSLKPEEYKGKIKNIISATTSKAIIKRLMELEEWKDYSFNSETSWGLDVSHPNLWKECFFEKYGKNATILEK
jgi:hypothetical protein